MADSEKGFAKGLWTGLTTATAACFAVYMFFLTDDPRVSRLNDELRNNEKEVRALQDSVRVLSSLGAEVASFEVPIGESTYGVKFWGNKITGDISARSGGQSVEIKVEIDTCKGRTNETDPRTQRPSCEETYRFEVHAGNYAPVGVADAQFLLQFVGTRDSMAVVRLIKVPEQS